MKKYIQRNCKYNKYKARKNYMTAGLIVQWNIKKKTK